MDVNPVPRIAGAMLLRPTPHIDERGFFCRTFDADVLRAAGIDPVAFVQHSLPFDDPELAIPWPLTASTMSQRDRLAPPLAAAARLLT